MAQSNTFQCVLSTDGQDTYAFFLYADVGQTLPNMHVQVGIDGGDGVNYYTVPGSFTPNIFNITYTSNVHQPGLWIFKLDNYMIGGN